VRLHGTTCYWDRGPRRWVFMIFREAYFTNQQLGRIGQLPRGAAWEAMPVSDDAYADGRIADEGILPLIVVAPGVARAGVATRQLAETVDLYPTLAELAGLPRPTGPQPIDGISLVPVLRDPEKRLRDHAYHCFPRGERMGRAIRTERHRLVEWKKPGAARETAEIEMYDYAIDPRETRNLRDDQPETVGRLRAMLDRHPEAR
jgi:arylsulfatase A-like enzyme